MYESMALKSPEHRYSRCWRAAVSIYFVNGKGNIQYWKSIEPTATSPTSHAWTPLCKCKGAYIRPTGLKGSIEEDDKNENIDAIRQVGTFPSGKCCHGRDRNNMCQENLSMQKLVIQEINISIKQRNEDSTHLLLGHCQLDLFHDGLNFKS